MFIHYGHESYYTSGGKPLCIRLDTVYVVEGLNHRISVFTHEGNFLASFGSEGNGSGQLKYKYPYRITVDKKGFIYVLSGSNNNHVQIF